MDSFRGRSSLGGVACDAERRRLNSPHLIASSLVPPGAFGPGTTLCLCIGFLGAGVAGVIAYAWLRAGALARSQAEEHALLVERAGRALSAGPSRVVEGRVDVDGRDDVAVEIDIVQQVRDVTNKSSRSHQWREVSRTVRAAPFYLVRDDGVSVYVEPTDDVLVVDSLETAYPMNRPRARIRSADVRRGERFFAYGDLVQGLHARAREGYRDELGWILRRPRTDRMLLATEAIRDRYKARISFLRASAFWLTLAFLAFHGMVTLPFVVASLFGTVTLAEATGAGTYLTHNKGRTTTHYVLSAHTAEGLTLKSDVSRAVYDEYRSARPNGAVEVPILQTAGWDRATYLGAEPSVNSAGTVLGVITAAFALLFLAFAYPTTLAWYDRKKLHEPGGSEHWRETRPAAPIDPTVS